MDPQLPTDSRLEQAAAIVRVASAGVVLTDFKSAMVMLLQAVPGGGCGRPGHRWFFDMASASDALASFARLAQYVEYLLAARPGLMNRINPAPRGIVLKLTP